MAADLLDLRRAVAEVLGRPWSGGWPGFLDEVARTARDGAVLWQDVADWGWHVENPREEWLPVLGDDGTRGVLLGELLRRGCWVRHLAVLPRGASLELETPAGLLTERQATLEEALARALVRVAAGRSDAR